MHIFSMGLFRPSQYSNNKTPLLKALQHSSGAGHYRMYPAHGVCTKDMLERLSISANMPTISLNCTYWSWTQLSMGQLQLGACHFGVGEQLEAKGHFAIVNSCGYSIFCKFLLNAKICWELKSRWNFLTNSKNSCHNG